MFTRLDIFDVVLRLGASIALVPLVAASSAVSARSDVCMPVPNGPCVPAPRPTPSPGPSPSYRNECDWDCKQENRRATKERQAWKVNNKGTQAHKRGEFAKARRFYNEALGKIPNFAATVSNLQLLDQHERFYNFVWAREAVDRGDYGKARTFFNLALGFPGTASSNAEIQEWLAYVDYLSKFKYGGSLLVLGTGSQVGWSAPSGSAEQLAKLNASNWIRDELALARRDLPEGVDTQIFNMGLGVAATTWEAGDLIQRVQYDQWSPLPVPRSGQSAYNAIKGRRFDLLGCHSNGAMTCLFALYNRDVVARDVVLYAPQITPDTARVWQQLLSKGKIRSLRIVMNTGDPIPPLAMVVNRSRNFSLRQRALLFNSAELKASLSQLMPSAQIDQRSCAFKISQPFSCHRMTAYPQCQAGKPTRLVPGTKGFLDRGYTEPPPPHC